MRIVIISGVERRRVMGNLTQKERYRADTAQTFGNDHIKPVAIDYVESGEWPWEIYEKAA